VADTSNRRKSPWVARPSRKLRYRSSARDAPGVAAAIAKLGKRVLALRGEAELTQEAASERARLDVKHWQDIERGRTNPTIATLVGVARALGVKVEALFV
jgi:DNA-binding XRE family transcriptional regulator